MTRKPQDPRHAGLDPASMRKSSWLFPRETRRIFSVSFGSGLNGFRLGCPGNDYN